MTSKKQRVQHSLLILMLLLPSFDLVAQAANKSAIAAFTQLKRDVWIQTDGHSKQPAKLGQQLFYGNIVVTGKSGYAVIMFVDGNQVKLQSSSELILQSRLQQQSLLTKLKLNIGKLWLNITKYSEKTEVHTPNAVASVKGTEFIIIYSPDSLTILGVIAGKVLISNEQGQELVESQQLSRVKQNRAPSKPEPFSQRQLNQLWGTDTPSEKTGELQPELLRQLLEKLGIADSLRDHIINNYSIHGGTENINKYLEIILDQDLDEIEWEIITDTQGIKRLRLLIKNP